MNNNKRSNKITYTEGYTPNFNDVRVRNRIITALGFTFSRVEEHEHKQLSTEWIDKFFGDSSHDLSAYLRTKFLRVVDNSYRFSTQELTPVERKAKIEDGSIKCKKYMQNEKGIDNIIAACNFTYDEQSNIKKKKGRKKKGSIQPEPAPIITDPKTLKNCIQYTAAKKEFTPMLSTNSQTYELKSNRLWGATQHLPKIIKRQIHFETSYVYEYDIKACAPTLLLQLARKFQPVDAKLIDDYLINAADRRLYLAQKYDIEIDIIKRSINALFAGGRIDQSIARLIKNRLKTCSFKNDPYIIVLMKEISTVWRVIKKHNPNMGWLSAKNKWAVYFSLEKSVLDVVINEFNATGNNHLPEHDGWTTKKQLDMDHIIKLIYDATGFDVQLSELIIGNNQDLIPII